MAAKHILVTGAQGFIGRNLLDALRRLEDVSVEAVGSSSSESELHDKLARAELVFHLAGVNRTKEPTDFDRVNRGLTEQIAETLLALKSKALVVYSSSTQAEQDNEYGRSKRAGEQTLLNASERGLNVCLYRLPGVFGKWSRPNYNTVVATWCHNVARGEAITISDPAHQLTLVYVDDVVQQFLTHIDCAPSKEAWGEVQETFDVTLGGLADLIRQFHAIRTTKTIPDLSDGLTKRLYSTYLSFLPENEFAYPAEMRTDPRGWLFELVKSDTFGQIFVSTTKPGITRGNHYHDTKVEKFCVVQGQGLIRFRHVASDKIIEYPVDDTAIQIVDIPPGYTHSIENTGQTDMLTLFWANEVFDPDRPDTYWEEVLK